MASSCVAGKTHKLRFVALHARWQSAGEQEPAASPSGNLRHLLHYLPAHGRPLTRLAGIDKQHARLPRRQAKPPYRRLPSVGAENIKIDAISYFSHVCVGKPTRFPSRGSHPLAGGDGVSSGVSQSIIRSSRTLCNPSEIGSSRLMRQEPGSRSRNPRPLVGHPITAADIWYSCGSLEAFSRTAMMLSTPAARSD